MYAGRTAQLALPFSYLPSIPGFPGLSRVSASPPGIPELVLSIPDYPGFTPRCHTATYKPTLLRGSLDNPS